MRILIGMTALLLAVPSTAAGLKSDPPSRAESIADAEDAIRAALADSAEGWARGDLDRFLRVYSADPATLFVTSTGVVRGTQQIRERYLKSYSAQFGAERGVATTLSFDVEDFQSIGPDHALIVARWTLTSPNAPAQTGMTSLLFRKETGGWKIFADHSS